ncbi:hypothetical protein CHS0354_028394 [Potamilus streckersoni]|uniref:Ras-GEF domain-containing family member 1B n=1 Tax=Potamilus streckersoni TaxID=2493646 RepID=A0AAE0VK08_9BIVA|nr:hypothetical protein CHS0354_028394 [Potamilus streckersoni]
MATETNHVNGKYIVTRTSDSRSSLYDRQIGHSPKTSRFTVKNGNLYVVKSSVHGISDIGTPGEFRYSASARMTSHIQSEVFSKGLSVVKNCPSSPPTNLAASFELGIRHYIQAPKMTGWGEIATASPAYCDKYSPTPVTRSNSIGDSFPIARQQVKQQSSIQVRAHSTKSLPDKILTHDAKNKPASTVVNPSAVLQNGNKFRAERKQDSDKGQKWLTSVSYPSSGSSSSQQFPGSVGSEGTSEDQELNSVSKFLQQESMQPSQLLRKSTDIFGVQLEVTLHLLEAEKRKLRTLQRELEERQLMGITSEEGNNQIEQLQANISHIQQQYDQLEQEYKTMATRVILRSFNLNPSSRSQPAIGLKQTSKTRPSIFGTIAEESKKEDNQLKSVSPQMLSLSQMFDRAGGGYDCQGSNCNENDALILRDGYLVSGSIEALIQHLVPTKEYNPDRTYVFIFLLSSRLFVRPHDLLAEVCQVCTFQQNLNAADNVQKEKLGKFGENIIQLLSEWTEMFPYDFRDERMMQHLSEISQRVVRVYPELRRDITTITQNLLNKLSNLQKYEETLAQLNAEAVKKSHSNAAPTTDIMEVCPSPLQLAQQLTHIELERLGQIGPEEFLQAFAKESKDSKTTYRDMKKTSNLEAYVQWFNRLSYLVATEVCSHLKKKNRVKMVEYLIDVAKECINIGNFNSLMAVIAGLNMSPVARLKKTWSKVNTDKLDILEHQMNPANNFGSYRSSLKAAMWRSQEGSDSREKIVIPFFSLFVKDIYFLNEGSADRLPNGHINFEKFWQLARHISDFVTWQQVECPFPKCPDVLNYILTAPVFSETTLSLATFECENPETSYDRERHKHLKAEAGL